jgi:uncharacterized membrane protein
MNQPFPWIRLFLLVLFAAVGPAAARPWGVTLIQPPTGTGTTRALAMNALGHVVGEYTTENRPRAYVYRDGVSTALPEPLGTTGSGAYGINASGDVVGYCRNVDLRACLWTGGGVTVLAVPPGARDTFAYDINDAGLIVGTYTDASLDTHVCVWQGGGLVYPLVPMGTTYSAATTVGNDGRFAGFFESASGSRACRWDSVATAVSLPLPVGSTESRADSINGVGLAVGSAWTVMGTTQACYWQGGVVDVLPSPGIGGSSAASVNAIGQIVGRFNPDGVMASYAWFWETGTPELLPRPAGVISSEAEVINDAGQIAVNFTYEEGPGRAGIMEEAFQPTLTIAGRKKVVTSKARVVVRGTTTDFVDRVTWKGKGEDGLAKGTREWRFSYRPQPGRNVVRVTANGPGGVSSPGRVVIVRR